ADPNDQNVTRTIGMRTSVCCVTPSWRTSAAVNTGRTSGTGTPMRIEPPRTSNSDKGGVFPPPGGGVVAGGVVPGGVVVAGGVVVGAGVVAAGGGEVDTLPETAAELP